MIFSDAHFSPCRTWRYTLRRVWDDTRPVMTACGLNPSTADEVKNDPTITRIINYAKRWGFGGLTMLNLFAFRSTDPKVMYRAADPVGPENDQAILDAAKTSAMFLACWGSHGKHRGRGDEVLALLRTYAACPVLCLNRNRDGSPVHPLYQRADAVPVTMFDFSPPLPGAKR